MNPKIICHMMSSVDGRLLQERWSLPFGGKEPLDLIAVYASLGREWNTDAWMFGRNTVQEGYLPEKFDRGNDSPSAFPETYHAPGRTGRVLVIPDPEGEIFYSRNTVRGDSMIAVLGTQVSDRYLEHLRRAGISYLFAGNDGKNLVEALRILSGSFGISSILLQGGGIINGAFLKAGLIDELSLVVYPGIDGLAGIPSIFEYPGSEGERPAEGLFLELKESRQMDGGIVWLHYHIHGTSRETGEGYL